MSELRQTGEGQIVLPVYLVVDTSYSLEGDIPSLNQATARFFRALTREPSTADLVRVCLIDFSDDARVVLPLSEVYDINSPPTLAARSATNYSAAFRLLRQVIPDDVAGLKHEGFRVFRPLVFFLTDGAPNDRDWRAVLDELRSPDFRQRPTIVAVGFGSADPTIIREIGKGKGGAFMVSDAISIPDAIESIWSALTPMLAGTLFSSMSAPRASLPIQVPRQWLNLN